MSGSRATARSSTRVGRRMRKRHAALELVRLPGAASFDDDPLLDQPDFLLQWLKGFPQLVEPLVELTSVRLVESAAGEPGEARLPAPSIPECSKTGRLDFDPAALEGRPRMPGSWALAFLHYVASTRVAMRKWWKQTEEQTWIDLFGFTHKPSYSEVALRFGELEAIERERGAFHALLRSLVRNARRHRPEIGQHVAYDGTIVQTRARLHHCCPNPAACQAAGGNPPRVIKRAGQELIQETRRHEIDDPLFDPERPPRGAGSLVRVTDTGALFKVGGHYYSANDPSSGVRAYTGPRKVYSWFGSLGCVAVDCATGVGLAAEAIAADVQEYTAWPIVLDQITDLLGEAPYTASFDGLSSIEKVFEHNTRHGVATVAPARKRGTKSREEWRQASFDEHGIPRCRHCGGEGDYDGPKLGLTFASGEPYLRFRCILEHTDACKGIQRIACCEDWRLLTPLSRTTLLYQALRRGHKAFENVFGHWRQRYRVFGKDRGGMLQKPGTDTQRLRAKTALALDWLRLNIRHGWLGNHTQLNPNRPRIDTGLGAERAARLKRARRLRGLNLPYGPRARQLGLAPPAPA